MKKSISKRIRITRTGKVMRRRMGQGHFRAGKTGTSIQNKRGALTIHGSDMRQIRAYGNRSGGVGKYNSR
jgi:ribosomal protein L35